jgi:hypothetical protein
MNRLPVASGINQASHSTRAAFPAGWTANSVSPADSFSTGKEYPRFGRNRIGIIFININLPAEAPTSLPLRLRG